MARSPKPAASPNLIDEGDGKICALEAELERVNASLAAVTAERDEALAALKPWEKRYANARGRVEAFNKIGRLIEQLGYTSPSHFKQ